MNRSVNLLFSYVDDDKAGTAIEYGLIASLISIAIAAVIMQIGTLVLTSFLDVRSHF